MPQGVSGSWDADASGKWEDRNLWLVSWHNGDDTSVRITFVDRDTNKYRHALLVEPTADDDFGPVEVHAGGITWYGDFLYVVDTLGGIRVFDLTNIWEVDIADAVGKNSDGSYSAAGYRYVIPHIRYVSFLLPWVFLIHGMAYNLGTPYTWVSAKNTSNNIQNIQMGPRHRL